MKNELFNTEFTAHAKFDRVYRINQIINHIGLGQIFREFYTTDKHGRPEYRCITDTGVTIIKNEARNKIITVYVTNMAELVALYKGRSNIPNWLMRKVDRNQTLYIKNRQTIWR